MEQMLLGEIKNKTKLNLLSRTALEDKYTQLESEYFYALKEIYRLKNQVITDEQLRLIAQERLAELNAELFGKSSEKFKKGHKEEKPEKPREKSIKKPSERYPNVPVRKVEIAMDSAPACSLCGETTKDSGLRETSEQLTVIPKKFEIIETSRVIYNCACCNGSLHTTPLPARIMEGSSYSDEMMMDVALSKYCDLIPVGRYAAIAARSGVKDIPPHSLIECTHYVASFSISIYDAIEKELMDNLILQADETPHRMLEGSEKSSWYLWGFSTKTAAYFECHDTRAGSVACNILKYSKCQILLTDKYSGYGSATEEANKFRAKNNLSLIKNSYCNAHSRRYFFKAMNGYSEATWYLEEWSKIYKLNDDAKGKPPDEVLKIRAEMMPIFDRMRDQAIIDILGVSEKSKLYKALNYFLENFDGLTLFITNAEVPIDNNSQERLLRSPVVGRKTWLGTHSERGARTAAILFTIVESCKLNGVNPREYLPIQIENIKRRLQVLTPSQFKQTILQ